MDLLLSYDDDVVKWPIEFGSNLSFCVHEVITLNWASWCYSDRDESSQVLYVQVWPLN